MTKSKRRPTITIKPNIQYEIYDETQVAIDAKPKGKKTRSNAKTYVKPIDAPIQNQITNIILHLKCSMKDLAEYNAEFNKQMTNPLVYNPEVPPEIKTYDNHIYSVYENTPHCDLAYSNTESIIHTTLPPVDTVLQNETECSTIQTVQDHENDMKEINQKLKRLKLNLYKNNLGDKKSACFWCTYEFDNEECYIPKYTMEDVINGYGSFCRPECAAAFLMSEAIDDSTKFERYHLLNQVYGKIYNYKKCIKPAPDPHYLLEKFYGSLTIQEYRKLLKSDHLLMILDKPLTKILPELHDDNENNTNDSKHKQIGMYKVKRQSDKHNTQSKASILREHFGL